MMPAGMIATTERRMVLGLGTTGLSVARWWRQQSLPFVAADTRSSFGDSPDVRQAVGADTTLFAGDFDPAEMDAVTELVVSPGIPLDHPLVVRAQDSGARVIGDIDLFCAAARAPVIGITGSNGKSTVTAMLGAMIEHCGYAVGVGGNFGTAALDLLADAPDWYVLELSSFQLERADSLELSVACVLNLSPDHLDRHGSFPLYHQAKHRIFRGAQSIVVHRGDPLTIPLMEQSVPITIWRTDEPDLGEFGIRDHCGEPWFFQGFDPLMPVSRLLLTGRHNQANALAALALGAAAGLPIEGLLEGVAQFRGLPHRCEWVSSHGGMRWINDSKGTNVGATQAAVQGLASDRNIILIAGGVGKEQDFSGLSSLTASHCRCVLTLGEAAEEIERALQGATLLQRVDSLEAAVAAAAQQGTSGDVVLLSPACASFDMFESYEARGARFRELVHALEQGTLQGADS